MQLPSLGFGMGWEWFANVELLFLLLPNFRCDINQTQSTAGSSFIQSSNFLSLIWRVRGWRSSNIGGAWEEQGTSQASLKIFEGVKRGWESILPLKIKQKNPTQPTNKNQNQSLFQINCYSLKAVVTSFEHFCNPAEHDSVELLPLESAAEALTGSHPSRMAF